MTRLGTGWAWQAWRDADWSGATRRSAERHGRHGLAGRHKDGLGTNGAWQARSVQTAIVRAGRRGKVARVAFWRDLIGRGKAGQVRDGQAWTRTGRAWQARSVQAAIVGTGHFWTGEAKHGRRG